MGTTKDTGPVERAFKQFAVAANKSGLHTLDWARFYRFVVTAHTFRVGWDSNKVQRRLMDAGFTKDKAEALAEAYWHSRCVLYVRRHMGYRDDYHAWMRKGGTPWT
jgi:hypothetical protein